MKTSTKLMLGTAILGAIGLGGTVKLVSASQ